jgi:hypothetical protein
MDSDGLGWTRMDSDIRPARESSGRTGAALPLRVGLNLADSAGGRRYNWSTDHAVLVNWSRRTGHRYSPPLPATATASTATASTATSYRYY